MKTTLLFTLLFLPVSFFPKPPDCSGNRKSGIPYISGDSFRALANHVLDETDASLQASEIKKNDIIFVKTDLLADFFNNIHPYIKDKYILISHNSDHGAPGNFVHYLDDEKIIVWFGQNPTISDHKKFIPIPIGIANRYLSHGSIETFNSVAQLHLPKSNTVGINFNIGTYKKERAPAHAYFSSKPYCERIGSANHGQYLKNMKKTKFIVCPRGNGLDCHRTWEALYMGAIPILISSNLDFLLSDLPAVIVASWPDVSEEFLHKKYDEIQKNWNSYSHEKIYFPYWAQLIDSYKIQN